MAPTITIDGNDVTNVAVSGSWTHTLNRPWQAQVKIPTTSKVGGAGSRLKIVNNGGIVFHGFCLLVETDQAEDNGYVTYNASDPMEMWQWRPVRDDTCDFSNPTIIEDYGTGPQIIEAALANSEGLGGCAGADCEDADADDCEGRLFIDYGTFEGGGPDLTGAPTDWPMTIAQLASLLISTGAVDIVCTPIDSGGNMVEVTGYNGDYGTDQSGSIVFEYGTGSRTIRRYRRSEDMTALSNKIWYFMGPRVQLPSDPGGVQHWCFNVQGDDTGLPLTLPNGQSLATLISNRLASRSAVGTRMDIQIFDAGECNANQPGTTVAECCNQDPLLAIFRNLYRNRWETESWIRTQPRDLVHITPTRDTEIGTFTPGDLVGVNIPLEGINAAQRVYSYTVSWDTDGVLALSELQTSPTAD